METTTNTNTANPTTPVVRGRSPELFTYVQNYLDKITKKSLVKTSDRLGSADLTKTINALNEQRKTALARETAAINAKVEAAQAEAARLQEAQATQATAPAVA